MLASQRRPRWTSDERVAMRKLMFVSAMLWAGCYVQPAQPYYPPYQQQPAPGQQPVATAPAPVPTPAPTPTAPPAPAPAPDTYGPQYVDVSAAPSGDTIPGVETFYDALSPYGTWYDDPSFGWVFAPQDASYVPYSNGHWKYTDYGFTWVSAEPFGWATSHYGRWVWANRWVWAPDTTWGPAWVQWRTGDRKSV